MRILALVAVGLALGGCASDRAAYRSQVADGMSAITRPATEEMGACYKSFVRNFQNKTADAVALDVALSSYCGKQEVAVEAAYFQISQTYPGVTSAHARLLSNELIASGHKDAVGKIVADQLQGR